MPPQKLSSQPPVPGATFPSRAAFQITYSLSLYTSGYSSTVYRSPNTTQHGPGNRLIMGCKKARNPGRGKEECPCRTGASPGAGGEWIVYEFDGRHNHAQSRLGSWVPPKPPLEGWESDSSNSDIDESDSEEEQENRGSGFSLDGIESDTPSQSKRQMIAPSSSRLPAFPAPPQRTSFSASVPSGSSTSKFPPHQTSSVPFKSRLPSSSNIGPRKPFQAPPPVRPPFPLPPLSLGIALPTLERILNLLDPILSRYAPLLHRCGIDNELSLVRLATFGTREEVESVLREVEYGEQAKISVICRNVLIGKIVDLGRS